MGRELGYLRGGDRVGSNSLTMTITKMCCLEYTEMYL